MNREPSLPNHEYRRRRSGKLWKEDEKKVAEFMATVPRNTQEERMAWVIIRNKLWAHYAQLRRRQCETPLTSSEEG